MTDKLIVIDGLDGCGKSTQFNLLIEYLKSNGIAVKGISFPDYDQPSSTLVKMYLNGDFSSKAESVNAYAASSFYAVDRYSSFKLFWEENYLNGDVILASRYTTSNAIHQMVKLPKEEWDSYITWLEDYEYEKLKLPKPEKVIFLDMPIEISQKLLSERYNGDENKKDIHEADIAYLYNCREAALFAAKKMNWTIIKCNDGDTPLSIDTIQKALQKAICI